MRDGMAPPDPLHLIAHPCRLSFPMLPSEIREVEERSTRVSIGDLHRAHALCDLEEIAYAGAKPITERPPELAPSPGMIQQAVVLHVVKDGSVLRLPQEYHVGMSDTSRPDRQELPVDIVRRDLASG